ncbi:MAG TPA: DinB family protein [Mycobacteriales bacterium]|nr:DinB family protein [Mycobacteriales bacterium]
MATFTSPLARTDPPFTNPELAALNSWLDHNRATLLSKLNGLTEEQAGQRMVGSDTTLHGIVRHMTTMEQWWFVECVAGQVEPYPYYDGEEVDWDWELDRSEGLQADVDRYLALCERARAITAAVDPAATFTTKRGNTIDIRWAMIGQIQEYARHNGHADIIRELIDGTTGE